MSNWRDAHIAAERTRADGLQLRLDAELGRSAQLEDLLEVERENTAAAYDSVKPPVTIITDSPTTTLDTGGGSAAGLTLAAPQTAKSAAAAADGRRAAATLAALVAAVLGVVWLVFRFGRKP